MSIWNALILLGAAAAALVPLGGRSESPLYLRWLGAIIATYIASVLYWDARGPYAEAFGFMCDCILVIAFVVAGRYKWEAWVAFLFLCSAFVNMAYLAHNLIGADILPHDVHGAILEVINILAIVTIGATAAFDRAGARDGRAFDPWLHILGRVRPVHRGGGPRS